MNFKVGDRVCASRNSSYNYPGAFYRGTLGTIIKSPEGTAHTQNGRWIVKFDNGAYFNMPESELLKVLNRKAEAYDIVLITRTGEHLGKLGTVLRDSQTQYGKNRMKLVELENGKKVIFQDKNLRPVEVGFK